LKRISITIIEETIFKYKDDESKLIEKGKGKNQEAPYEQLK
jgi:hypothetical protein